MQAGLTSLIEENKKIKDQLKVFKSYSYIGFTRELLTIILDDEAILRKEIFANKNKELINQCFVEIKKAKNYANIIFYLLKTPLILKKMGFSKLGIHL